ncbi:MAG: PDZ domain-containing protein [Candidatus Cloacimonetes bacterium]|nr:PDZ domain-containing protein [Candidatus Cloacimonadota bacterium]
MKSLITIISILFIFTLGAIEPKFMRDPAISPDGETVCFSYMTDLWLVPFAGGEAKRITVSAGDDRAPSFSPDGKWIAFSSNREGFNGIYIIPAEGGQAELVSRDVNSVSDWFNDSQRILGTRNEMQTGTGLYEVYLDGTRAREITPVGNHFAKLSPDNTKIVFNIRGMPYRPAYRGSVSGDLWEYDIVNDSYTQLTNTDLTERYPVYSHVSPHIYYGASDGQLFQLFRTENYDFANQEQLTNFATWSLRDISIARQKDRLVFEKFDAIYRYDAEIGIVEKIDIIIRQDFLSNYQVREKYFNKMKNFAVSPDGKFIAFSYKFDLFAMPEKGGEVKQLTFDKKGIEDIVILPDNRTIYFLMRDQGTPHLYSVDIQDPDNIVKNLWSEGKYIQYIYPLFNNFLAIHYEIGEDRWKVALMETNTGEIFDIMEEFPVWSRFIAVTPDAKYAFYVTTRRQVWSRHLYLYDMQNKTSKLLLNHSEYIGNLFLGHDMKSLFMTWGSDLARLDLLPIPDFYKEKDNWQEILEPEIEKESGKNDTSEEVEIKVEFEGLRSRINIISSRSGTNYVAHVICDSTLYYVNQQRNTYTLRKIDYYGRNDEEIISFTGNVSNWQYNEANKNFYAVIDETLYRINPSTRRRDMITNEFEYEYNELELNKRVFDELWVEFGRNFYDYQMHDRDWVEMYQRYRPYVQYSYITDYLSYVVDEMIGELNASHTGFYPRSANGVDIVRAAYTGLVLDYSNRLNEGIQVKKIYRHSSLYQANGIRAGDLLLSVDGIKITPSTSIESLFAGKIDKKIVLEFRTPQGLKKAEIKGLSYGQQYDLYYENWVAERREIVDNLTDNRLGYIHIRRMNQPSLQQFTTDLFAENYDKEAIVLDVRFNGGGNISRSLLDILTREYRAYTTSRGFPSEQFKSPGQIWEKPLVLLINENSFSDAEIFPILFQQLGLGKVIGVPTSGGVIGTTPYQLMDGSSMRLPRSGWYTLDGINMEGSGATPDIFVDHSPEQIINDDDQQLKTAIQVLMRKLQE